MKKVPKLRFPEFEGEWEESRFKNLFKEVREKTNDTKKYKLYSLTIENGVIPKSKRYEREFLISKEENYKIVHENEYVYNPMNLRFGALGRYMGRKPVSVSGYYNIFKLIDNPAYEFWDNFLKSNKMMYLYNTIATGSLIEKRRVHFSQFIELTQPIPSPVEQQKIATFFSLMDKKIQKQQQKVEALEVYKKGMMQKIFSQEIRFKDDNGEDFPEWEYKKLRDYAKKIIRKNKDYSVKNVISNSAKNGLVAQRDFFDKDIANGTNINGYYVIKKGDFVYNPRKSLECPYGPINRYNLDEAGVVSPLYLCLQINKNINKDFLAYYFKSSKWHKFIYKNSDQGARHDRVSIKDSMVLEMDIKVPSLDEQVLIADYFDTIQKKFTSEQLKLKYLIHWKKGLLQKMFI